GLEFRDRTAELLAISCIGERFVQRRACRADRAGADIDAPAIQSHHRDAEAFSFTTDAIGDRHAAVVEDHLRRGLAVPSHLSLLLAEGKTGSALLDDQAGNAPGTVLSGTHHADIDIR